MEKAKVKDCILIDCISFTVISVIQSILATNSDLGMEMSAEIYLQLFICTSLIAILIYFTDRIPTDSRLVAHAMTLADVALVIFGVGGGIFHWFPWELGYMVEVGITLTIVYFITTGIMYWQDREVAKAINKKIEENHHE